MDIDREESRMTPRFLTESEIMSDKVCHAASQHLLFIGEW